MDGVGREVLGDEEVAGAPTDLGVEMGRVLDDDVESARGCGEGGEELGLLPCCRASWSRCEQVGLHPLCKKRQQSVAVGGLECTDEAVACHQHRGLTDHECPGGMAGDCGGVPQHIRAGPTADVVRGAQLGKLARELPTEEAAGAVVVEEPGQVGVGDGG